MSPPGARRGVGIALTASGVVLLVLAVLFWTRFLPVNEESRAILASAVFVAALADLVIGVRFLGSSDL
jgi:hypothetical protein